MHTDEQQLADWARAMAGLSPVPGDWERVAGDASGRKYFRLGRSPDTRIAALSPPQSEKNREFQQVQRLLAEHGISVPRIFAHDSERGFFLLEDLGDEALLGRLQGSGDIQLYQGAFNLLLQLAAVPPRVDGRYDRELLTEELSRFPRWFLEGLLEQPDTGAMTLLDDLRERLIDNALAQPTVLVHRDFHSRNLMCADGGELALIDFQDAVVGPITYDLVSLLRDCYIRWPRRLVHELALQYKTRLEFMGLLQPMPEQRFLQWFDLMGLQRHIKVLGTFARLWLRDGKQAYLADLPLVVRYVREVSEDYAATEPAVAAFADYFESLQPVIARQSWSEPA